MDLSKILAARTSGKRSGNDPERPPEPPPAALSGGALVINCSQCRYAPDPGTAECIRCMERRVESVGYKVAMTRGDHVKYSARQRTDS